jgi:hypothetical protein
MKIEVAPVSAIACNAAMAIALRYCVLGVPNGSLAVAAIDLLLVACTLHTFGTSCIQFHVMIAMPMDFWLDTKKRKSRYKYLAA